MFTIASGRATAGVVEYHREEIGEWLGEGAEVLGLPVGQAVALANSLPPLLAGLHPRTNARLVQRLRKNRVPAVEAVIASPKSVSLAAHGLLPGISACAVQDAHREAVGVVCAEVARLIGAQDGGQGKPVLLAIEHTRSRANDVHLHTHLVLPNLVRRRDAWFAFNPSHLFQAKLWLDSVFSHALGYALSRAGIAWQRPEPRRLEISACPPSLIAEHSASRAVVGQSHDAKARTLREQRAIKVGPEPQFDGPPVKECPGSALPSEARIDQAVLEQLERGRQEQPAYSVRRHLLLDLVRMDFKAPLAVLRQGVERLLGRLAAWTRRALDITAGVFRIGGHAIETEPDEPLAQGLKARPIEPDARPLDVPQAPTQTTHER